MIIALVYLAGVAMFSMESWQNKNSENSISNQLIIKENDLSTTVQKENCYTFTDFKDDLLLTENLFKTFSESGKELFCVAHPPGRPGIFKFSSFARPPPAIAFS